MRKLVTLIKNFIGSCLPESFFLKRRSQFFIENLGNHPITDHPDPASLPDSWLQASRFKEHILVLSHSDYMVSLGGTEKIIFEQSIMLEEKGIGVIQIFPTTTHIPWKRREQNVFGVNVDGISVGHFEFDYLFSMLNLTQPTNVIVHHTLHWPIAYILKIINKFADKNIPATVYLHDFHLLCPNTNLSCSNMMEPCFKRKSQPYTEHHKCETSINQGALNLWREKSLDLLSNAATKIISPSEFLKDIFVHQFKIDVNKIHVQSPVTLSDTPPQQSVQAKKIKVAYLGYQHPIKGWDTWLLLSQNRRLQRDYDFFHIGTDTQYSKRVQVFNYDFMSDGPHRASEILKEQGIDIVLLWPKVPESFSFTYHEAKAAGCKIITNNLSGNIQNLIKKNPSDNELLLNSDSELLKFFYDFEKVKNFVSTPRKTSNPHPNLSFDNQPRT